MTAHTRPAAAAPAGSRLHGDSRGVVLVATWLVGLLAAVGFVIGVPGLVEVASWAGLTGWLRFGIPVVLDAGLVIFALAAVVRRARRESAVFALTVLGVLTVLSVAAQVGHVILPAEYHPVAGSLVAAMAPLTVFAATHTLLDLAIAPAVKHHRRGDPEAMTRPGDPATGSQDPATYRVGLAGGGPVREDRGPVPVTHMSDPAVAPVSPGHGPATLSVVAPVHGSAVTPDGVPGGPVGTSPMTRSTLGSHEIMRPSTSHTATPADVDDRVAKVAEMKNRRHTNPAIAGELGVSESTVKRLVREATARGLIQKEA